MVDPRVVEAQLGEGHFVDPSHPRYLGNPDVVNRLIARFCAETEADVRQVAARRLEVARAKADMLARAKRYADIVAGRDPEWTIVRGYHNVSLGGKLRADLREFWPKVRDEADNDPYRVLFLWLAALVADAYKRWPDAGDDHMRAEHLRPGVRYANQVLLGVEERVRPEAPLQKSHVKGYVKKDGTFVPDYYNKVVKSPKQGGLFGSPKQQAVLFAKPAAYHPKADDEGAPVPIHVPHKPALEGLHDAESSVTVTPGAKLPVDALNGVAFAPWQPPHDAKGWGEVDGQLIIEDEPDLAPLKPGQKFSTGLVMMEPDGRLWLVSPTNGFGGYGTTFPKGRFEEDEWSSYQSNAIKEAWEETGLKARIVGFLGDVDRSTTRTRYYLARREGGTPADMGWESQAVHLVPLSEAREFLDSKFDHQVLDLVEQALSANGGKLPDPWA